MYTDICSVVVFKMYTKDCVAAGANALFNEAGH